MEDYSVLMSVYAKEQPDFLIAAVESIFSQTVKTNDFVLVCDGPLTDSLNAAIHKLEEKYSPFLNIVRFERNRGLALALNDGIEYCKNSLVARMDSDDIALVNRCEIQLKEFEKDKDLKIVGGAIAEFDKNPQEIITQKSMPTSHTDILSYAKKRCPFNHPTVMYRKEIVLAAGGYPNIPFHEDYALWVKVLMDGAKSYNCPEVLCNMRVNNGLYDRRGGFKYFKTAASFRVYMHKIGFSGFIDMCYVIFALAVVCLVPTFVRKNIYRILLRRK